jgi:3-methyladenine DNA glycosylase AlkD
MTLEELKIDIKSQGDPVRAEHSLRFFKTGKGQYGYGDVFLGLSLPQIRLITKKYKDLPLKELKALLHSKIHEERLIALIILVNQFKRNPDDREKIFNFYLNNTKYINNWDLVDVTCPQIVGTYLLDKDKKVLYTLAKSDSLWEKRIAIISTLMFIKNGNFKDTLKISEMLLNDKHDLIHKAVGWCLREVGKKDVKTLDAFLDKHVKAMPRTALRYAIEKFPEPKRQHYLRA